MKYQPGFLVGYENIKVGEITIIQRIKIVPLFFLLLEQ